MRNKLARALRSLADRLDGPESPKSLTISFDFGALDSYVEGRRFYIETATGHTVAIGREEKSRWKRPITEPKPEA